MKRMEIGAWRLALGGVKMLGWRTSDRASSRMRKCEKVKIEK